MTTTTRMILTSKVYIFYRFDDIYIVNSTANGIFLIYLIVNKSLFSFSKHIFYSVQRLINLLTKPFNQQSFHIV